MEISVQPCTFGHALIGTISRNLIVAVEIAPTIEVLMARFINHWSKPSHKREFFINEGTPNPFLIEKILSVWVRLG